MRRLSLWLPPLLWMGVIFELSSKSDLGAAGRVPDWIGHGGAWLILCGLLCRGLAGGLRPISRAAALLAVGLATAYGIADEYHQSFVPGREASAADVVKDLGGATLGAFLFRRAAPSLRRRAAGA